MDKRKLARLQGSFGGMPQKGFKPKTPVNIASLSAGPSMCQYEENSPKSQPEKKEPAKELSTSGWTDLSIGPNRFSDISRIYFCRDFINETEADAFLSELSSPRHIKWEHPDLIIQGETYRLPRLVSWFGPLPYTFSGVTLEANAQWPPPVLEILERVNATLLKENLNVKFNSVLVNLYRNGKDSVAWHSDDELSMGVHPTIASVSFGDRRRFELRRKPQKYSDARMEDNPEYVLHLTHGSLCIMDGKMQADWQHRVPKEFHDRESRINLTFRTVFPMRKDLKETRHT